MPASGGDPITSALRIGLSAVGKVNSHIDCGIEASAKRVLQTHIRFEPSSNHQNEILSSLKSKYTVIHTKPDENCVKSNLMNGANKKSAVHLPIPKSILYPTERVQLGFRGNVPVGSGMVNVGNTCYLNSTLQALFHVPAFVNWLLSEPAHLKCEQTADYQVHPDDITCAVIKTLKCSQQKTGTAMKPMCIYSKLKAICKHLSLGSQEDAHEFMRYLLESLEKGFLTKVQGHQLESWSKETTPVNQIFGGYIRTEVVCLSCHAVSTTFQHFQDLPLDIRRASTLDDALAGYFERERLPEGEDAYKCEKCGRKVSATKKFSLERPPNVLCIQFKRFNMNGKLTKQVQLSQNLDLTRFVSPAVKPRHPVRYRLVSMVTHMGQSANCGHYTAIALAANGSYYQFDDGSVRSIPLSTVLSISAYLLLYELERPFSPCGPRAGATAAESTDYCKSETASVGGSDVKESVTNGSPTAGSPAPCSRSSAPSTSLVPYDSDTDSEMENKETERVSGVWKVSSIPPPVQSSPLKTCSASWRVTDITSPQRSTVADTPTPSTGEARTTSTDRSNAEKPHKTHVNGNDRNRDVVAELIQNSHQGYGNNIVRTWNGMPSNMERQVDHERRENRKRTYDEEYNTDFDRGKQNKKRRHDFVRDQRSDQSRVRYNPFQQRANEQNAWRYNNNNNNNRYDYNQKFQRSNWGFPRNHHRSYYSKNYNNCSR